MGAKMNSKFIISFGLLTVVLGGCASTSYKTEVSVTKKDVTFYSAKYIGEQPNCFPPIDRPVCTPSSKNDVLYEPIAKLEMEEFQITLGNVGIGSSYKDFIYLTAADIAIQRGFKYFTVTSQSESGGCISNYTANSYGTVSNGSYVGTTSISPNPICAAATTISIIAFNRKVDLAAGVFEEFNSGYLASILKNISPNISLYYGTSPGLKPTFDTTSDTSGHNTYRTFENAWKNFYDANGLSKDLRTKYHISDSSPYTIIDERAINEQDNSNDLIKKNRITSP
jgi:hypothetical protein